MELHGKTLDDVITQLAALRLCIIQLEMSNLIWKKQSSKSNKVYEKVQAELDKLIP